MERTFLEKLTVDNFMTNSCMFSMKTERKGMLKNLEMLVRSRQIGHPKCVTVSLNFQWKSVKFLIMTIFMLFSSSKSRNVGSVTNF